MHIAILDDEDIFREQIKIIITDQFPTYSISSFATVSEILKCEKDFDILLLDIDMPEIDGITSFILAILFVGVSFLLQAEYSLKKRVIKPLLYINALRVIVFLITILISNTGILQIYIVVELIVSISLIPERRKYER